MKYSMCDLVTSSPALFEAAILVKSTHLKKIML